MAYKRLIYTEEVANNLTVNINSDLPYLKPELDKVNNLIEVVTIDNNEDPVISSSGDFSGYVKMSEKGSYFLIPDFLNAPSAFFSGDLMPLGQGHFYSFTGSIHELLIVPDSVNIATHYMVILHQFD